MLEQLIEFDQSLLLLVNGSKSLYLDGLVKTLTTAVTWVPLYISLIILVIRNNDNMRRITFILGCAALCYLMAGALDDGFVKPMVARWRPTHDPDIGWQVDIVNGYRGGKYGFFSAHASNTFSIAVFLSLLVRNRLLTVSLVSWSLVNCWTRMYLGVHFPGDILCGLLWGGTVGTSVYMLYRYVVVRYSTDMQFVSSQYSKSGYQHKDVDFVVCILLLTVIYAQMRACFMLFI